MKRPASIIVALMRAFLFAVPASAPASVHAQPTAPGVAPLNTALDREMQVNKVLTDPAFDKNVAAIRAALQQGTPLVQEIMTNLQTAQGQTSGQTQQYVQMAIDEVTSITQLAQLIQTAPDPQALVAFQELVTHGTVALSLTNLGLNILNAGPSAPGAGHLLQTSDLTVPDGYQAEIVANGLNFLTSIAVAQDGTVYVTEAGYAYVLTGNGPDALGSRPVAGPDNMYGVTQGGWYG
jgi:hypothetical protein